MAFQFAPLPDHVMERLEKQRREDEKERLRIKQKEEEVAHRNAMYRLYKKRILDNPRLFLDTKGLYSYDPDGCISSRHLYEIYRSWCIQENIPISTPRTFWLRMKEYAPEYAMTYCTITGQDGKRYRGFRGIRPLEDAVPDADKGAL